MSQSAIEKQYLAVQADLKEVSRDLSIFATQTKELHDDFIRGASQIGEINNRLSSVEQLVVSLESGALGYAPGHISGRLPSLAAAITQEAETNHSFSALRQWTPGAACRFEAKLGVNAALTNSGAGGEGSTSIPRQPERGGYYGEPQAPLNLIQVLPVRPTASDSVEFIQIGVTGEAGEQVKEGDEKAELEFSGILRKFEVATIAAHTTASKQVLEDHAALTGEVDRMIRYSLLARLENQLINGNGNPGKITGLLSTAIVYTPTVATEPADRIGEALTHMQQAGFAPNVVIMNPMDWFSIQITKTEEDKNYLFGSPTQPIPPSLWNTIVVRSQFMPVGHVLCVDTSQVTLVDREKTSVVMSNSHKDYFTRNLVAILGEMRALLEVRDLRAVRVLYINQPVSSV